MPSFDRFEDMEAVSIVTGPSHVTLAIRFSRVPPRTVQLIAREPSNICECKGIEPESLKQLAISTVRELNRTSVSKLHPLRIAYFPNDSSRESLYAHCINLLYERAAKNQLQVS